METRTFLFRSRPFLWLRQYHSWSGVYGEVRYKSCPPLYLVMNDIKKNTKMLGESSDQSVVKRSIVIAGHKTSVSLEDAFWRSLRVIAAAKEMTLAELVAMIDKGRQQGNLSSHIRLFVLEYYKSLAATSNTPQETISSTTGTTAI